MTMALSGGDSRDWSIFMLFVRTWEDLKASFEARASEWGLAGAIATIGVVLLFNHTLFVSSPEYETMRVLAPQWVWAYACIAIGFSRWTVLLINGTYWSTPHFRSAFAFLSGFVWFMLMAGSAQNGGILIALIPWLLGLDVYNSIRAAREAGASQFVRGVKKKAADGKPKP